MTVNVATTGNFVATTNCPASLAPTLLGAPASCKIDVTFRPLAAGPRTGTLSTGTVGLLAPTAGPTVALSGTGTGSSLAAAGGTGKKCKKQKHKGHRRSAHSAKKKSKKCKGKKKKHHRAAA